jgi:hypothetical protein
MQIRLSSSSSPSPLTASLFITITGFRCYGLHVGLVYSIYDSYIPVIRRILKRDKGKRVVEMTRGRLAINN